MKSKFWLSALCLCSLTAFPQAQMTNGPELDNDRDSKMNRMLGGDDNSFYCYRINGRGRGTSFIIEKYNKKTLKPEFSKSVTLDEEKKTKIEDVEYAVGNVFVFRREYDKKGDKMALFFQTVSSSGQVSDQLKEIVSINSEHPNFVDFDIIPNPGQTKFLIKVCHKPNSKAEYTTDFILMDAAGMKKVWTKTINQKLMTYNLEASLQVFGIRHEFQDAGFVGLYLDDQDNFYYGYTVETKNSTKEERRYRLNMATMESGSTTPKNVELTFDDDYFVRDIEFMKSNNNEIVVGGYIKDVIERVGADLVKVGIFSFKINLATNSVASKAISFFDEKMLTALESNARRSKHFRYKLDYILPVGDAVYYIGEQYNERYVTNYNSSGSSSSYWAYEYMDVIVAKLGKDGKYEWIKNVPLRNEMRMNFAHVFKQYIAFATQKNLYILCDDHPKNIERYQKADFEPKDLKSVQGIHGSNFVCNVVNLSDGKVTNRIVLMKNEDYCFAPIQERNPQFIPPSDCEIFVPGKDNTIFIYTEDRGRDRFANIKFE